MTLITDICDVIISELSWKNGFFFFWLKTHGRMVITCTVGKRGKDATDIFENHERGVVLTF